MPNVRTSTQWTSFQTLASTVLTRRDAGVLTSRWKHWEEHKGTQWLVDRQKALLTFVKLRLSNRPNQALQVLDEASIARCNKDSMPKGIEGRLVKRALSNNARVSRRAFAILRAYTGLFLRETSAAQILKSRTSINDLPTGAKPKFVAMHEFERDNTLTTRKWYKCKEPLTLGSITQLRGLTSYPNLCNMRSRNERLPYESMVASLMSKGLVPQSLLNYYGRDFLLRMNAQGNQTISGDNTLGEIIVLQEGGAKGRVICSPNAWIQYYMYPLHQYLFSLIKREESHETDILYGLSCVTDQLRGAYAAAARMDDGGFVASVDLSSATDRFPLWLQQGLLRFMGLEPFAQAFSELKGPYRSPEGDTWFYNTGQPMGVYSSFPLFHLSHLYVLRWCSKQLDLDPNAVHFAVLGDDVLVFNEELHSYYRFVIKNLGVSISEHKSYSGSIAEFAGLVIQQGVKPYRPYKWGRDLSFGPVITTLYSFGGKSKRLGNWWSKAFSHFVKTVGLRDLSLAPLVPLEDAVTGVQPEVSVDYLLSLSTLYESRSSASHIHSLISPSLIHRLDDEWSSMLQKQDGLVSPGIDPNSFIGRSPDWEDPRVTFSRDPLIASILAN